MRPSETLTRHRDAIRRIADSHRGCNVRAFASVFRGTDRACSDLDLLVAPTEKTTSLDLAAITVELEIVWCTIRNDIPDLEKRIESMCVNP